MERKRAVEYCLLGMLVLGPGTVMAADYSKYSTEELAAMRGTMANASQEEREAFRNEWQKRMQEMSQEERSAYSRGGGSGSGSCSGSGQGYGQGRGRGYGRGRR